MITIKYTFGPNVLGDDTSFETAADYAQLLDTSMQAQFPGASIAIATYPGLVGMTLSVAGVAYGEVNEYLQQHFDDWSQR